MRKKVIYLLLCASMLFSCDYYKEKKAKEEAIKMEEARKEQDVIARQKDIEEQEAKKQDMKNNIAKYVYIDSSDSYNRYIVNDTDYTIDEVIYEYSEVVLDSNGYWMTDGYNSDGTQKFKRKITQEKVYYIPAHSKKRVSKILIITSIKCKALGIN